MHPCTQVLPDESLDRCLPARVRTCMWLLRELAAIDCALPELISVILVPTGGTSGTSGWEATSARAAPGC